jgi:GAF domain-containing protein
MSQTPTERNATGAETRPGWARLTLQYAKRIETAISDLLGLQERAKRICRTVRREFDYDFVALQLVDRRAQTIQTVYGIGSNKDAWYTTASHSIEGPRKYLDIQAHVAVTHPPTAEIIAGPNEKFDRFIYEKFGHAHFVRAFVPLIVARDTDGHLTQADLKHFDITTTRNNGSRIIQLTPRRDGGTGHARPYEIIGTIEAGFDNAARKNPKRILAADAIELLRHACRDADLLCRSTLLSVLQVIAESAREITGADAITLHFPFTADAPAGPDEAERRPYEAWVGPHFAGIRPRGGGLGALAIRDDKPKFLPQIVGSPGKNRFKELNPQARRNGVRSMAAFPLIVKQQPVGLANRNPSDASAGALYVGYTTEHEFTLDEIEGVQLFTDLAKDAIRHASAHVLTLQASRQLYNLQHIARALADNPDTDDLLPTIAGHAINVLAADFVIIHEYRADDDRFVDQVALAGRYDPRPGDPGAKDGYAPAPAIIRRLARKSGVLTALTPQAICGLYAGAGDRRPGPDFIETQNLKTAAAVMINFRDEALGVMFVNYRRKPMHSDEELESIATALASTAAVAIHARRSLQARQSSLHAMAHQFKSPINALQAPVQDIKRMIAGDRGPAARGLQEMVQQIHENLILLSVWCDGIYTSLSSEAGKRMPMKSAVIDVETEIIRLWNIIKDVKAADQTLRFSCGAAAPARS